MAVDRVVKFHLGKGLRPAGRSRRALLRLASGGMLASTLLLANSASAGPNEQPRQFSYNPSVADLWVLKYQYSRGGLLVSTDGGASWGIICGDALDGMPRPKETYGMAVAADGSVFLGDFSGLLVGRDNACSWSYVEELQGFWVTDLQPDPLDENRLFAVTSSGGKENGMWAYDALSQSWSQMGALELLTISSLHVLAKPDGGLRFYQSVVRNDPETYEPSFFIRYSDDEGMTWTEFDYPMQTAPWLWIVAADPMNPDRLVAVEKRGPDDDPDRVMISEEAGATGSFQVVSDDSHLGGAVFLPDGALYVGRTTGGMNVVRSPGAEPEYLELFVKGEEDSLVKPAPRTLSYHPERGLLAGVLEDFGTIDTATGEFVSMLDFREVASFHSCPGRDLAAECKEQLNFDAWCVHPGFDTSPFCVDAYKGGAATTASADATQGTKMDSAVAEMMSMPADNGLVPTTAAAGTTADATADAEDVGSPVAAGTPVASGGEDSGGCSCHVGQRATNDGAGLMATLAGVFLWRQRRRRRGRQGR